MGNKQIGERISLRREQLNLTLDDIALQIGVARSTVQRYEKGSIEKIKLPVIEAIARVLQVSPDWLCCKSEDMASPQDIACHAQNKRLAKGSPFNTIKLVGRDGTYREERLSDDELALFQSMLDHLKPVTDDSI